GDILRALAYPCKEDPCGGGPAWVECRMGFTQPPVHRPADTAKLPACFCVCTWLDSAASDQHVNLETERAVAEAVLCIDDEVLRNRVFEDVCDPSAHELRSFVLDAVIELLVHLPKGPDVHVEEIWLRTGDLLDDLVGVLERVHATEPGAVWLADPGV